MGVQDTGNVLEELYVAREMLSAQGKRTDLDANAPKLPADWDYDESVSKVQGFVYKAKNLTKDVLEELYVAREMLSKTGAAGHVENLSSANAPLKTWAQYCSDINIDKSTANRWLKSALSLRGSTPKSLTCQRICLGVRLPRSLCLY